MKLRKLALALVPLGFLGFSSVCLGSAIAETADAINNITVGGSSAGYTGPDSSDGTGGTYTTTIAISELANNNAAGFTIAVKSTNGGHLLHEDSGSDDGDKLEYEFTCDEIANGNGAGVEQYTFSALTDDKLTAVNQTVYTSTQASGVAFTLHADVDCTLTAEAGEVDELFAGDYTDTITFTISNS